MPHIPVVYCDDSLLVVLKPHGLLTVPGRTPDNADCLWSRLKLEHPHKDVRLVHRLDRDTAGLILFALSPEAQRRLGQAFEHRRIHKEYLAIVRPAPPEDTGQIDAPLRKDWTRNDPPVYIVDPQRGKSARTRYQILWRRGDLAGLRLFPETGRSHQLRVHMLHLGCPILGDPIYAPPTPTHTPGLQLVASRLAFPHPITSHPITFRHEPPAFLSPPPSEIFPNNGNLKTSSSDSRNPPTHSSPCTFPHHGIL